VKFILGFRLQWVLVGLRHGSAPRWGNRGCQGRTSGGSPITAPSPDPVNTPRHPSPFLGPDHAAGAVPRLSLPQQQVHDPAPADVWSAAGVFVGCRRTSGRVTLSS